MTAYLRAFALSSVSLPLIACGGAIGPDASAGDASPDGAIADAGPSADAGLADAGSPSFDAGSDAALDAGLTDAGPHECDPVTADPTSFLAAYRDALCEKYRVCAPYTSARNEICSPSVFDLVTREWTDGLASGAWRLVPEEACRCLDELRSGVCQLWTAVVACAGIFERTSDECSSTVGCDVHEACDLSGGACPGTCVELPGEGMPCRDGVSCDVDLRCVSGTCVRPGSIGAPCDGYEDCAIDLYCDSPSSGAPGTCRGPAALGERCGSNAYCVEGLVCADGLCGPGQPLGATCGGLDRCALGLRCEDGTCTRFLGPAVACASDEECWAGFRCDGTCQPLPIVGEPCPLGTCYLGTCVAGACRRSTAGSPCSGAHVAYLDECEDGLYCDPSTSTCTAGAGAGDSCISSLQCPRGLVCDDTRRCAAPECAP